jgi:hypothetical protein
MICFVSMKRASRKTEVLVLRLTPAEKDRLIDAAARADRSPSDAARHACRTWVERILNPTGLATGNLQEMRHA